MRHSVRAIILKNKQLLLVTGHDSYYYWTPGGRVEGTETLIDTLKREIKEELGVSITTHKPYYSDTANDQRSDYFLVEINGDIKVGEEITGFAWYDSATTNIKTSEHFENDLGPRLIKDGLIT